MTDQYALLRSLLVANPSIINSVDADGRTALHWAASSGALDITRYLIDNGAEVDERDAGGWSALHIAGAPVSSGS
jgi:26S proteasome non-ATPase regulatory subunit 10